MKGIDFTVRSKLVYERLFEELLDNLKEEKNVQKINLAIAQASGGHPLFSINFRELAPSFPIYRVTRARYITNENKYKPNSFSIPNLNPYPMQRANIENHPVFYGSFLEDTAVGETISDVEEEFYISKWEFIGDDELYSFILANDSTQRSDILSEKIGEAFKIMTSNIDEDLANNFQFGYKKVINLFTNPKSDYYNISSAIAHNVLFGFKEKIVNTPILIYPSVKKTGNHYNVAIHPDHALNKNTFRLSTLVKCKLRPDKKGLIYLEKGTVINETIIWNKISVSLLFIDFNKVQITQNNQGRFVDSISTTIIRNGSRENLLLFLQQYESILKEFVENQMSTVQDTIDFYSRDKSKFTTNISVPLKDNQIIEIESVRIESIIIKIHYAIG